MKLGFSLPLAGPWATPENQVLIAERAESLGYHSLWVFQRLLYAIRPQNDYPPLPGQPWPKPFERVMDPLVSRLRPGYAPPARGETAPSVRVKPSGTSTSSRLRSWTDARPRPIKAESIPPCRMSSTFSTPGGPAAARPHR